MKKIFFLLVIGLGVTQFSLAQTPIELVSVKPEQIQQDESKRVLRKDLQNVVQEIFDLHGSKSSGRSGYTVMNSWHKKFVIPNTYSMEYFFEIRYYRYGSLKSACVYINTQTGEIRAVHPRSNNTRTNDFPGYYLLDDDAGDNILNVNSINQDDNV